MTEFRHRYCTIAAHTYMICSALATLSLFLSAPEMAMIFFAFGGSSGYIAFGAAVADPRILNPLVSFMAFLWSILFVVVLIAFYVLSTKKHFIPMCVLMAVDAFVVISWVLFAGFSGNDYGAKMFLFDAVFSSAQVVLYIWSTRPGCKTRKTD